MDQHRSAKVAPLVAVLAVLGVCFLVASVWLLIKEPSLVGAWGVVVWTLAIVSIVNQFRVFRRGTDAPSKVRREARVTVDGNYDEVFDRCESAMRKLGAKVISLDRDSGQIHARTGLSWYSWGEKVDISVTKQADTVYSVVLSSDSIQVTSADLGKNSKNLQVLLENL
jgi:hypothetical protein